MPGILLRMLHILTNLIVTTAPWGCCHYLLHVADGEAEVKSLKHLANYIQWSIIQRKEILTHTVPWMILEDIVLRERSQTPRDKYCMMPLI